MLSSSDAPTPSAPSPAFVPDVIIASYFWPARAAQELFYSGVLPFTARLDFNNIVALQFYKINLRASTRYFIFYSRSILYSHFQYLQSDLRY